MNRLVFASILVLGLVGLQGPRVHAAQSAGTTYGRWTVTPSMPAPLMSHQAVLLHDGRVLMLGGESVLGVPTAAAQVYDPSTHVWSTEPSMHTARIGFTASVLWDGRVLVAGGIGTNMNDLASAELFDPRTNIWTMLPALPQTRFSQSASLLPDGRVLLAGGIVDHIISRSTIIFDPSHNTFVSGPPTHFPHAQQSVITLRNGHVLLAGGYGGNPELYDPASNTWKTAGSTPLRVRPIMSLLPDGTVLLAGGTGRRDRDLRSAQIFHPADDRWTNTSSLPVRGNSEFGALLRNGQVMVAGGEQVDHHVLKTVELYDAAAHVWRTAAPMHVARSGSTSTLLPDGSLLVCGGGGFTGAVSSCETFRPSSVPSSSSTALTTAMAPAMSVLAAPASTPATIHPGLFALPAADFPAGSHVSRTGIESNRRLIQDQPLHFGLPPAAAGRLTGYYADAVEGDEAVQPHPYTSYLVSIFRTARLAQDALDSRWDTWFAATYYTTPSSPRVSLGDPGTESIFHTLDPTRAPLSELMFRRGAVLVEVFQGTVAAHPSSDELHAFRTIATQLDTLAAQHPRGV